MIPPAHVKFIMKSLIAIYLPYSGLLSRGNISRMPSGAIIHKENFHECMAFTNSAILTPAISQGKFSRIKLNS